MRRSVTFRIENTIYSEIEMMSKTRGIPISKVVCELMEIGLRVKKHMENKKPGSQEPLQVNYRHLEVGASSAIEMLLLLRRMLKESHPDWLTEAHEETIERVNKLNEQ